jgi:uncharacterized protein YcnI
MPSDAERSQPMRSRPRRSPTGRRWSVPILAALGMLLLAGPAAAHPFFRGGEAPVDSLAELTLELAHGCGSETGGEGADTTEVSLEVPEWMRIVDVPEPDGWQLDLERDVAGRVAVVTWRTSAPTEPAPSFGFEAVLDGEPGEERYLSVFQACGDLVERWVGTPDEPADDPAVRLTLADRDPDRPAPPPEPTPDPEEPEGSEEATTDPDASEAETDEPPVEEVEAADDGTEADEVGVVTTAEEARFPWVAVATILVVLLVAGGLALLRRRQGSEPGR